MRATFLLSFLLISAIVMGADMEDCSKASPAERDGCYLAKATGPDGCKPISDVYMRDQCFIGIAEHYAKTYRDCDALYQQYQPLCYARLTYESGKGQMSCEDLEISLQGECYIYFAERRGIDIYSCVTIPPNYRESCYSKFFGKAGIKSEADCRNTYSDRYLEECLSYVGSNTNPLSFSLSLIEGAWGFFTSSNTIMWVSVGVFVIIFGLVLRLVLPGLKKREENL